MQPLGYAGEKEKESSASPDKSGEAPIEGGRTGDPFEEAEQEEVAQLAHKPSVGHATQHLTISASLFAAHGLQHGWQSLVTDCAATIASKPQHK